MPRSSSRSRFRAWGDRPLPSSGGREAAYRNGLAGGPDAKKRGTMLKRIGLVLLIVAILVPVLIAAQGQLQKTAINFPTRSGASWPMFIAKEGGYYQKYGLDVNLAFGAGPVGVAMIASGEAAMTNSSMEQALQATSRDPSSMV